MNKLITFEGGSGFGKSTMSAEFKKKSDFLVYGSISEDVYKRMQGQGRSPAEEFSNIYYDIRLKQYQESLLESEVKYTLFDRFLFFPIAMRIFAKVKIPNYYYTVLEEQCKVESVFIFEPIPLNEYANGWPRESISYDESMFINDITLKLVEDLGYQTTLIPFGSVQERCRTILQSLSSLEN